MTADWLNDALRMKMAEGKSWREIAETLIDHFPGKDVIRAKDLIRVAVCRSEAWKREHPKDDTQPGYNSSHGWRNGVYESDDLVKMCREDAKSPRRMLELHGLNPDEWEVVTCRNNLWHSQVHGTGERLQLYQSRLTAKPIKDQITLKDVERWFAGHDFKTAKPPVLPARFDPDGETLEIDVADPHSGLLAWWRETGEDYDVNIARERFFSAMRDILARCEGRKFKRIILALLGDLLHTDNDNQTTTKGTFQQTDGRMSRVFTKTLDMLIEAIDWFGAIAPVEVVYTRGNHDSLTGWTLIKSVEQAYRKDTNVTVDVSPDPQKHRLIGCTLVGFVHGNMPEKNLSGWLQVRARKMDKPIKFMEVHTGHRHAQKVKERVQTEDGEGVVVRTMPTIANSSTWEHEQGYDGATHCVVCFVWDDARGLREMWYSNM